MQIRLLGPLELVTDRGPVELSSPRSRAVLAALALQANLVTPVERLIDAVWDEDPPATARAQIRICVSDLRRSFRDAGIGASIETRPSGYLLEIRGRALDVAEFERLVAVAKRQARSDDHAAAAASLRAAEDLWRGPALSGVPGAAARAAATALDEARLAATEERLRFELELGRHQQVISELRELTGRLPLREGLQRALMLALYRAGRTAEALEVYQRARTALVEELGVEPGPALRELHRSMLDRSPALDPQPSPDAEPPAVTLPPPRQLPAAIADFTGREEQLESLRETLTSGRGQASYGVRIAGISGPGGVGKSTLAVRAAHELVPQFPDGQLYAQIRTAGDDPVMSTLDRFLRALGVSGTAVPKGREDREQLYRSRLAGRRMLVVLDDVTDEADVVPLLPGDPSCGVVVTSRARLSGLQGAQLVDVGTLDPDRSVRLLDRLLGADRVAAEPEPTRRLADLCGGLPLALRISAARLVARPHWQVAELVARLQDEAGRLDELAHRGLELRASIGLGYQSIDDEARRLFRLFALVDGPDAPAWTAAALLDTDAARASDALDRLAEAQLVTAVRYDDARGVRYRFHDLVRVYAAEQLARTEPADQRHAALRRLLGGWLALAVAAHGAEYCGDHTVVHGGAERWLPEEVDVSSDPMAWLDRERAPLVAAVHQAAANGLDDLAWDLAMTLITLFEHKGYAADWLSTATVALEAAEHAGNRLGCAAMHYSLGALHVQQMSDYDRAAELFGLALEEFRAVGNDHGVGLALRNLANVDRHRDDFAAARSHGAEGLDLLRAVGDVPAEAHLLSRLALIELRDGDVAEARRLVDQGFALVDRHGYRRGVAQLLYVSASVYAAAGDLAAARSTEQRVLELVRELDDQVGLAYALTALGHIERRDGRTERAAEVFRQAVELARAVGQFALAQRARDELDAIGGH